MAERAVIGRVLANDAAAPGCLRLTVEGRFAGRMGQFYMLRAWDRYPLLNRPFSIHDLGDGYIRFLYRAAGQGTAMLAALRPGDAVSLEGPFGNGFPRCAGAVALVGGGMGIAPLLLAAKQLPHADAYLGFRTQPFALEPFRHASSSVHVEVGGSILDRLDPTRYDHILACGPLPMLRALAALTEGSRAKLWVSIEARMACGIGACLACSFEAAGGERRKACADGPVFAAEELDFDELDRV